MIRYVTCRIPNIIPCFQRILRQDQCLYSFNKNLMYREFCLDFGNLNRDDKYSGLRNRLEAIPSLKMLEKEEDKIRHDLCFEKDEKLKDVQNVCSKIFDYNARIGYKIPTTVLLKTYCAYGFNMDDPTWKQWDSDKWRSAVTLAWCVELLQIGFLVLDDIMDQSVLRKGEPCWYKVSNAGLRAVNDACFLFSGVYKLLQKHFAGSQYYLNILHEFHQAKLYGVYGQCLDMMFTRKNKKPRFDMFIFEKYKTLTEYKNARFNYVLPVRLAMHLAELNSVYGQCLDMMFTRKNKKPRFDMFTFEKYKTLTEYKNARFFYVLPVRLAMHLAEKYSDKEYEYQRKLCLKLGLYFQMKNDKLDCFGKPEATGKIGNDIAEGKCSWLSVKFLEEATQPMKKEFFENYGVADKYAIANVLELYKKTHLLERFEETEAQLSAEIGLLIESKNDIKGTLFYDLLADLQKMN